MTKFKILVAVLLVGLLLPATMFANSQNEAAAVAEDDGIFTIGMSQCNLGEPWRVQMNADVKKEADKHDNIKVVYKDAQNDTLKQRAHVEEFISAGVDLLIISPLESQPLVKPVSAAMAAGIPVIVLDRALVGEDFTQFIGADNVVISAAAGVWAVENFNGKGAKVVELMGLQTSIPGHDRHDGFAKSLEGSDLEIIFSADCKWLEANGRKEMESALSRFDNIDIVYGHNDPATHGAYLAAKAAGREDEMVFIGVDALPHEGIAYVKDGIFDVTFQYPTGGDIAIKEAIKIFDGQAVKKKIVLGTRKFSTEDVDNGGVEI